MSKLILIVEDDVLYLKMLKRMLESRGYKTITARDGLEGLNLAREKKPDLIFLDLILPKMDGHKVCRLLKYDRKVKHIPVVILTSRDMDEDEKLAKQCGANAFIIKTTRHEIVMDVMEKLLDKISEI